ncbi:MAG: transporter substrate-binding domain-containing protein [Pseudomonadota bacterium]
MLRLSSLVALVALGLSGLTAPPVSANGDLTVCLPRNAGVIAGRRLTGGSGFDFRMSEAVAARLGQSLTVVWYENELEEESDPLMETYAMLSYRLCDLVPGHPRYVGAVGTPSFARASLPRWLGMPRDVDPLTGLLKDRLAGYVDVAPIAVSAGYMRSEIGLVYREGTPEPTGLNDTGGRALAVQQGVLSGAIAMLQSTPEVRAKITTHNPGPGFLWDVESGGGDLAIIDVPAFDTHMAANPFSALRLAAWRHGFGMDLGFAALAENQALLDEVSEALEALVTSGEAAALAGEEGLTYAPPRDEALAPPLTRASLLALQ